MARPRSKLRIQGSARAPETPVAPIPASGKINRYLLTCAQSNTRLFEPAWKTLQTIARDLNAKVLVARLTYDQARNGGRREKAGAKKAPGALERKVWFDPRVRPYLSDSRLRLAPGLVWCGELNILPTAERPLSGLSAYTGRDSTIVPHPKIAMESVPSGKYEATKLMYTTGTVTQRNYIQRKAGQKAQFHHCYGALLVEVDNSGSWWCRQLNAASDGVVYDLDIRYSGRKIKRRVPVEGITWGDIHVPFHDRPNAAAAWGLGASGKQRSMIDTLRPRHQFFHDILDFRARNPHDRLDSHLQFRRYVRSENSVAKEVGAVAEFLNATHRPYSKSVVVDSNHDNFLTRWLREADYRADPDNAVFFLEAQLATYRAVGANQRNFHLLEWAVQGLLTHPVRFLREDESFIICPDANGGIECGLHSHLGPNGRRGTAVSFARMGRKSILGHSHSACIIDGAYQAGTSSELDMEYNRGPSSWTHSHVITYQNGKRAIVTVWKGRWRA